MKLTIRNFSFNLRPQVNLLFSVMLRYFTSEDDGIEILWKWIDGGSDLFIMKSTYTDLSGFIFIRHLVRPGCQLNTITFTILLTCYKVLIYFCLSF